MILIHIPSLKFYSYDGYWWLTPWLRRDTKYKYTHAAEFSALLALWEGNPPVTSGFPLQRQVTRSFDVLFDLRQKKTVAQTLETPVIWDPIVLFMTSL